MLDFVGDILNSVFKLVGLDLKPDHQKGTAGVDYTAPSTETAIPIYYGAMRRVSGTIVYRSSRDIQSTDIENDYLDLIIVWCESNGAKIEQIYIDDKPINSGDFLDDGERFASATHYYGTRSHNLYGWDSELNHPEGLVYSHVRLRWHEDNLFSARPNITADIKQSSIYDVRTHAQSASTSNPALQLYDYLINPIYGKGLSASELDTQSFIRAATQCDLLVDAYKGGRKVPLYTSNVKLESDKSVKSNCETLLKAMRASLLVVDGLLTLVLDDNRPAVSYELNEDTIVSEIEASDASKKDRFNQVTVEYTDTQRNGKTQSVVFPDKDSELDTQWLSEDNGIRLNQTFRIKTLNNAQEAKRLAEFIARKSREQLSIKLTARDDAALLVIGDIVKVSHDALGFMQKPFTLSEMTLKPNGEVDLKLTEHQPSHYFWQDGVPDAPIPDTLFNNEVPDPPSALNAYSGPDNSVELRWDSPQTNFEYQVYQEDKRIQGGETVTPFLPLTLVSGVYRVYVAAVNRLGKRSRFSSISFQLAHPVKPTIEIDAVTHDTVTLSARSDESALNTHFEWQFLGSKDKPKQGRLVKSDVYTFTGLAPLTDYIFQCRTKNASGESPWQHVEVTTRSAKEVLQSYGLAVEDPKFTGAFTLTQAPHWSGRVGQWQPSTLDNQAVFEVSYLDEVIARKSLMVKLDPHTGVITYHDVTGPTDKQADDIAFSAIGEGTNSIMIRASHTQGVTVYQGFSSPLFSANTPDFDAIDEHVDALTDAIFSNILDNEESFDADLSQTLALEKKTDETLSQLNQVAITLAEEDRALAQSITQLDTQVADNHASVLVAHKALSEQDKATALALTTLNSKVDNNQANLEQYYYTKADSDETVSTLKTSLQSQMAQNQAELNANYYTASEADKAISSQIEAQSVTIHGQKMAYNQALLQLEADSKGNATSIQQLTQSIDEVDSATQANASSLSKVTRHSDDTYSSLVQLASAISDPDGASSAQLNIQSVKDKVGGLTSRAFLGVNQGGQVTGVHIEGSDNASTIDLAAGKLRLLNNQSQPSVYWDAELGRYVFDGEIVARRLKIGGSDIYNISQLRGQDGRNGVDGRDGINGRDGVDGTPGRNGSNGSNGSAGSGIYRGSSSPSSGFINAAGRYPVKGDIYISTNEGRAYNYTGWSWSAMSAFIDGSLLVSGTVTADKVRANTKIQSPIIEGGEIRLLGSSFMKVSRSNPFGPDNLVEWYGPKMMSGSEPNWSLLRKSNAITYLSANGEAYFGGTLTAGTFKNSISTSVETRNPSVILGPFSTNGNRRTVVVSFSFKGSSIRWHRPSTTTTRCNLHLYRSVNGSSYTQIAQKTLNGSMNITVDEPPPGAGQVYYHLNEVLSGAITTTDYASGDKISYKAEIKNQTAYHLNNDIKEQFLSIISTE